MLPQRPAASPLELSSSLKTEMPWDRPRSRTESRPSPQPDSRSGPTLLSRSTAVIQISLRALLLHLPPARTLLLLLHWISLCRSSARRQSRESTARPGSTPCISLRSAAPFREMCSSQQITMVLCSAPTPFLLQRCRRLVARQKSYSPWRHASSPRTNHPRTCRAKFHPSRWVYSCCLFSACDTRDARARS